MLAPFLPINGRWWHDFDSLAGYATDALGRAVQTSLWPYLQLNDAALGPEALRNFGSNLGVVLRMTE